MDDFMLTQSSYDEFALTTNSSLINTSCTSSSNVTEASTCTSSNSVTDVSNSSVHATFDNGYVLNNVYFNIPSSLQSLPSSIPDSKNNMVSECNKNDGKIGNNGKDENDDTTPISTPPQSPKIKILENLNLESNNSNKKIKIIDNGTYIKIDDNYETLFKDMKKHISNCNNRILPEPIDFDLKKNNEINPNVQGKINDYLRSKMLVNFSSLINIYYEDENKLELAFAYYKNGTLHTVVKILMQGTTIQNNIKILYGYDTVLYGIYNIHTLSGTFNKMDDDNEYNILMYSCINNLNNHQYLDYITIIEQLSEFINSIFNSSKKNLKFKYNCPDI